MSDFLFYSLAWAEALGMIDFDGGYLVIGLIKDKSIINQKWCGCTEEGVVQNTQKIDFKLYKM